MRQVEQMLADRPDMAGLLKDDDPIVQWVAAGFNGDRTGQRIYWNAASPPSGNPGEHWPQYYNYPPQIIVSGGAETTRIDRWVAVVFEQFNIENDEAFAELASRAIAGDVDRDGYAVGCAKLEFAALLKCREFFEQHKLPTSHGNHPYHKFVLSAPPTIEEYFAILDRSWGYNPVKYYQADYDDRLAPQIESGKQSNATSGGEAEAE